MYFFSDLDNTLIHSYKKKNPGDICIEHFEGREQSFISPAAYQMLEKIVLKCTFIPVTTRSVVQYRRLKLLKAPYPLFALASNGANLLIEGVVDEQWRLESETLLSKDYDKMMEIKQEGEKALGVQFRLVDGFFLFLKHAKAPEIFAYLKELVGSAPFQVDFVGQKIYVMPQTLNKGQGVKRFERRFGREKVVAAGDSLLDLPMLALADRAFVPPEYQHMAPSFQWHRDRPLAEFALESVLAILNETF